MTEGDGTDRLPNVPQMAMQEHSASGKARDSDLEDEVTCSCGEEFFSYTRFDSTGQRMMPHNVCPRCGKKERLIRVRWMPKNR